MNSIEVSQASNDPDGTAEPGSKVPYLDSSENEPRPHPKGWLRRRLATMSWLHYTKAILIGTCLVGALSLLAYLATEWAFENDYEPYLGIFFYVIDLALLIYLPRRLLTRRRPTLRAFSPMEALLTMAAWLTLAVFHYSQIGMGEDNFTAAMATVIITSLLWVFGVILLQRRDISSDEVYAMPGVRRSDVDRATEAVLSSDVFVTSLRSAIPRFAADQEPGLTHIPFLLARIGERRAALESASKIFLLATVAFGLLSTAVVTAYGYVLLDKAQLGLDRRLEAMSELLHAYSEQSLSVPREWREALALKLSSREKEALARFLTGPGQGAAVNSACADPLVGPEFRFSRREARDAPALGDYLDRCGRAIEAALPIVKGSGSASARELLTSRIELVEKLRRRLEELNRERGTIEAGIRNLATQARAEAAQQHSPYYEIAKRIAVGILVISFFIAVLRYLSQEYRLHASYVLREDAEENAVRRFFVGYTCSKNEADRTAAIKEFVASRPSVGAALSGNDEPRVGLSAAEQKVLGDVFDILKKRI